jgi:transcriptional regulator with XRE-family HTH domain
MTNYLTQKLETNELIRINLIKLRIEKQLTQKKLAEIGCVGRGKIAKIETKVTKTIDMQMLQRISQYFGLELNYFFTVK